MAKKQETYVCGVCGKEKDGKCFGRRKTRTGIWTRRNQCKKCLLEYAAKFKKLQRETDRMNYNKPAKTKIINVLREPIDFEFRPPKSVTDSFVSSVYK